jgi:hypothetical protein
LEGGACDLKTFCMQKAERLSQCIAAAVPKLNLSRVDKVDITPDVQRVHDLPRMVVTSSESDPPH